MAVEVAVAVVDTIAAAAADTIAAAVVAVVAADTAVTTEVLPV